MSIFEDIYNWLAQRNVGELLGLRWDPEKDKKFQHQRLIDNAESWLYSMDMAEKELSQGNIQTAGHLAYRALEQFPDANLSITKEVVTRAKSIIARLPEDFNPPVPMIGLWTNSFARGKRPRVTRSVQWLGRAGFRQRG